MNEPSAPSVLRHRNLDWAAWLAVLGVIIFIASIRGRVLDLPLERDEGEYAYAGQLILEGIPPYKLAYNMKLPGTYYAYAAGMMVFGQTPTGVHLTLLVANALSIGLMFLLGRSLFGTMAGVVAAASYGLLSVSPAVLGMAAHANHFVVLFALPGVLLLWKAGQAGRKWPFFGAGVYFGMAYLMKQQALFFGFFGLIFVGWNELKRHSSISTAMKRGLAFGSGMLLPFGLLCLLMWRMGVFEKFWFWTFTYARSYATSLPLTEGILCFADYVRVPLHIYVYSGFLLLAVAGLILARQNERLQTQLAFVLAFTLFSFGAVAIGFYFREHYFIQILPALALLTGLAVTLLQYRLEHVMSKRKALVVATLLFAGIAAGNVLCQRDYFFTMSPAEISRNSYTENYFPETIPVADYIRQHSAPEDVIAVVGSEPQIYFNARRHSGTGFIYTYALMEPHPYAVTMQREMAHEIEQSRPKFLVEIGYNNSWAYRTGSQREILDWFANYVVKDYHLVGLVDLATNNTRYLWEDDAKNVQGDVQHYIAVYRRKSE